MEAGSPLPLEAEFSLRLVLGDSRRPNVGDSRLLVPEPEGGDSRFFARESLLVEEADEASGASSQLTFLSDIAGCCLSVDAGN